MNQRPRAKDGEVYIAAGLAGSTLRVSNSGKTEIFLFSRTSTSAMGSLVNGWLGYFSGIKLPKRDVDQSFASRAEVKIELRHSTAPIYDFIPWAGKTLYFK
jgi:hypothetical protein